MKHYLTLASCVTARYTARVPIFHALLLLGLGVYFMPLTGYTVSRPHECLATACDHRYGATATWSQTTDTAQTNSMFYAEACGFKFNMALTVFDSPFSTGAAYVPVAQRQEAARTGRLSFQIYFQTDRWRAPNVAASEQNLMIKYPRIPDYYATRWTAAGVAAGFKVTPGDAKRTRTPNHGQQMFDLSGGEYGFSLAGSQKGRWDALSDLAEVHCEWVKANFGHYPSAGAYRNGQRGATGGMSPFFLGLRNSGATGELRYGTSPEGHSFLGSSKPFTPVESRSMASTTRAGDMDLPREKVLTLCSDLLRKAIQTRGWYRDFIHWHTVPRFQTTLHDLLEAHRNEIGSVDVVTLNYGEALEHKFLRDMATVSAAKETDGIMIQVTYKDPYGGLPLRAIQIPLSVKVNLAGTALEGRKITCPEACGVRKLSESLVVVDVPFHQREESVTVHLREAVGAPGSLDFSLPSVVSVKLTGQRLHVRTDRPTRLALFTLPVGLALASVYPAGTQRTATVELVGRDNTLTERHIMDLGATAPELMACDLYIGVISKERQSILWGPKRFRDLNKF